MIKEQLFMHICDIHTLSLKIYEPMTIGIVNIIKPLQLHSEAKTYYQLTAGGESINFINA
jgi:hypothetical protein